LRVKREDEGRRKKENRKKGKVVEERKNKVKLEISDIHILLTSSINPDSDLIILILKK
jgi:hypothetical protein